MGIVKTAGIFFFNKELKLLIGHPTKHDIWSIPKGKIEENEESWDAALRETWEETNVDLKSVTVFHTLESVRYKNGKKKLKSFVVFENENPTIDSTTFDLKCNSIIGPDSSWNVGLPEMDDFKWVTIEEARELLHQAQIECLDTIIDLINKTNG